jgi:hypothetical protein
MVEIDFHKIGIDPRHAAAVTYGTVLDSNIDLSTGSECVADVQRDTGSELGSEGPCLKGLAVVVAGESSVPEQPAD